MKTLLLPPFFLLFLAAIMDEATTADASLVDVVVDNVADVDMGAAVAATGLASVVLEKVEKDTGVAVAATSSVMSIFLFLVFLPPEI